MLFGGDFATYVFWAVSRGFATNVGEFVLEATEASSMSPPDSKRSACESLNPTTWCGHPAVLSHGKYKLKSDLSGGGNLEIPYRGYQGEYKFTRESIPKAEAKSEMRTELFRLKSRGTCRTRPGGAYALVKLTDQESLKKAERRKKAGWTKQIAILGKEAVRLAFEAQTGAEKPGSRRKRRQLNERSSPRMRLRPSAEPPKRPAQGGARLAGEEPRARGEPKAQAAARSREEERLAGPPKKPRRQSQVAAASATGNAKRPESNGAGAGADRGPAQPPRPDVNPPDILLTPAKPPCVRKPEVIVLPAFS